MEAFYLSGIILIIFFFITVSFLFFQRNSKTAYYNCRMRWTLRDVDGLPIQIDVKKKDEIGQLEANI